MRIAIVGSGVSGLVAARGLHAEHDVTLFEADQRIGGHVHTWDVPVRDGSVAVDSGFIVYNTRNYPRFTALLADLGVATQSSTMSFSVRSDHDRLEYNGSTFRQLFAQPTNALRPTFLRMLAEVVRFNRTAVEQVQRQPAEWTLHELLEAGKYSRAFKEWYLLPMGSAIWSMSPASVLAMPAHFFVRFFSNHGMLSIDQRPEWRVVTGGSQRYVAALVAPFRDRIRSGCPVHRVERLLDRVEVNGESFDTVVFACHSDQVLRVLVQPTASETEILGAIPYQANEAILHTDTTVLPRKRRAWAAWNYRITADPSAAAFVTYNMNDLQSLRADETYCVTLNPDAPIDPSRIMGRTCYWHPLFSVAATVAQQRRGEISGVAATHYCGAYWGNGFHEDGVVSGEAVVREVRLACSRPVATR